MKLHGPTAKDFRPVTLELDIESAGELHALYAIFNYGRIVSTIPNASSDGQLWRQALERCPGFSEDEAERCFKALKESLSRAH